MATTHARKKPYETPTIVRYSIKEILELIGPAVANYGMQMID